MNRYRAKLVMANIQDCHYFYAPTLIAAHDILAALQDEIPSEIPRSVYIYVETSLGHVRIK